MSRLGMFMKKIAPWRIWGIPNLAIGPIAVLSPISTLITDFNLSTSLQQHQPSSMSLMHSPPPGARSIDQILETARSKLIRLSPEQLLTELESSSKPVHVVDIRPAAQRELEGSFLVAPNCESQTLQLHIIERNVLEWRLDPQCESRLKDVVDAEGYETRIVIICSESYTSSLAAASLKEMGLRNATDLLGGQKAWKEFRASTWKSS